MRNEERPLFTHMHEFEIRLRCNICGLVLGTRMLAVNHAKQHQRRNEARLSSNIPRTDRVERRYVIWEAKP